MLLSLLLDTPLLLFPDGPVFPFGNPLLVTLLWPFRVFSYLTGNPFFRQPICGMWALGLYFAFLCHSDKFYIHLTKP